MIFFLILLLAILLCGYVHSIFGLFSAAISAVCALFATVISLGYYESLASLINNGKVADDAAAICIAALFLFSYFLLRLLLDHFVSGNVRYHVLVDKIGAAAMGLIAGFFAAGVAAVAIQTLPLDASILGYSRFTLFVHDNITMPGEGGARQAITASAHNRLTPMHPATDAENGPQLAGGPLNMDAAAVGLTAMVSSGSLSGSTSWDAVHPDFLAELFGQRLAVQEGARHTALPGSVNIIGVWRVDRSVKGIDAEDYRIRGTTQPASVTQPLTPGWSILIVRAQIATNNAENSGVVGFGPYDVRLVLNGVNKYPIGTFDGSRFYANHLDDYLFIKTPDKDKVDLAFLVEDDLAFPAGVPQAPQEPILVHDGFLEFKRWARASVSDTELNPGSPPADASVGVMKKIFLNP